jgi:NAD(P)-dependent dehydrogenase (short-subunit alcohol dehydrogenase family)
MVKWAVADMPDLTGRTVVVTGANSGIGLVAARALAGAGASVIMACRDVSKGAAVAPDTAEVRVLDLANLASVREFASSIDTDVDILVNNAGVMAVPHRRTADGFEMQIGTNHLGHFALTGLLLDRLRGRVVTVASAMHRAGRIRLDDLNWERRPYRRWSAYGQSKLANLLFTFELSRRSALTAVAAHPGYASTNLHSHTESLRDFVMMLGNRFVAQSAEMGALPTLYAATVDVPSGSYVGPGGLFENWGHPKLVGSTRAARDPEMAAGLWDLSEELTGVRYDFARARPGAG